MQAILSLILMVLIIVSTCKILAKAEVEWWKGIIPIYSEYCICDIAGRVDIFKKEMICMVASVVVAICESVIVASSMAASFTGAATNTMSVPSIICGVLLFILSICVIVLNVLKSIALAESFGKGKAFAIGLVFLPYIFYAILAFSQAEYEGVEE